MVLVPVNCFNPDFSFRPQFKQNCGPVWGTLQIFYNMRDDVKFISFNRIVPVHWFQVCFHQCCSCFILTFHFRPRFEQNCSTVLRYFLDLFSSVCTKQSTHEGAPAKSTHEVAATTKAPNKLLQQQTTPTKLLQETWSVHWSSSSRPS